jgi:hypothetical protein
MSTMGCNEFTNQLEAWMEGEHTSEASAHVRECRHCRSLIEDMDAIRQTAGAWAAVEIEPPIRIWASLRVQLEQEGLIHSDAASTVPGTLLDTAQNPARERAGWLERIFGVAARPVLAGAYLAALVAVSVALTGTSTKQLNDETWMSGTQRSTGPLSAQLQTAELATMSNLAETNPVVTTTLHDNLAIVDNYIALCEKSVREDPQNEFARDYLYDAYEQKADLLAQMNERGVNDR